jgi:hypothetical protein
VILKIPSKHELTLSSLGRHEKGEFIVEEQGLLVFDGLFAFA